jgi:hypothetical protein
VCHLKIKTHLIHGEKRERDRCVKRTKERKRAEGGRCEINYVPLNFSGRCRYYLEAACCLPPAGFLLGSLFNLEYGGDMILRNVG